MIRNSLILAAILGLSGCFIEPSEFPPIPAQQDQFIPTTPEVCTNINDAFDHYNFYGYSEADSIQWFDVYQGDTTFLATGNPIEVPIVNQNRRFFCYQFYPNGDTIISQTQFFGCIQGFYFPNSFSPRSGDGLNDCFRILSNLEYNPISSAYWQVMTLDGITLFETSNLNECWDGTFNGNVLPTDSYILYIEIEFESGDDYYYSGLLTIVE
jgi:gliding motility-associated-like protein